MIIWNKEYNTVLIKEKGRFLNNFIIYAAHYIVYTLHHGGHFVILLSSNMAAKTFVFRISVDWQQTKNRARTGRMHDLRTIMLLAHFKPAYYFS